MEYYSALRKKDLQIFVTIWMNLDHGTLSEISQTEKDMYSKISLMSRIQKSQILKTEGKMVATRNRG